MTAIEKIAVPATDRPLEDRPRFLARMTQPISAVTRATIFFLKLFPMIPSRPVDWVTRPPVIQKVRYPTPHGEVEGDLYLPAGIGPYPGILVCLGVVPFGVEHPQVPIMGKAFARAGFAALLYWSPAMRELRLDPEDIHGIAMAYRWLVAQPYVDAARSGLLGTCVGGSFALMAAAHPLIREHVDFISAYAPFSSMWTFARDIASATRSNGNGPEPWVVDPLTRKVFVHSLTVSLEPSEAERLQSALDHPNRSLDPRRLSADGQAVYSLLSARSVSDAEIALQRLPAAMRERLAAMTPINYIHDIKAPLIVLLHDRGDQVIPVGESRRLHAALAGHRPVRYTEMGFQHLDPAKGKLPFTCLLREFGKFFFAVLPMFRRAAAA